MSISVRKIVGFYFENKRIKKVLNVSADYEPEMRSEEVIEKLRQWAEKNPYGLPDWQINDLLTVIDYPKFSAYDLASYEYNWDNDMGFILHSPWDKSLYRFKDDVDWYPNVEKGEFIEQEVVMGYSASTAKAGLVHQSRKKVASYEKGDFIPEETLVEIYQELFKQPATSISKPEFYKAMQSKGFKMYVNPVYFALAEIFGILKPDVSLEDFNKAGRMSVIMSWS